MNQEFKKIWIEALRSGRYKQVKGGLHCADGFCCLGVAEDLLQKAEGSQWSEEKGISGWRNSACGDSSILSTWSAERIGITQVGQAMTDEAVSKMLELYESFGRKDMSPDEICLSALNDAGATFEQIANIIEKHF